MLSVAALDPDVLKSDFMADLAAAFRHSPFVADFAVDGDFAIFHCEDDIFDDHSHREDDFFGIRNNERDPARADVQDLRPQFFGSERVVELSPKHMPVRNLKSKVLASLNLENLFGKRVLEAGFVDTQESSLEKEIGLRGRDAEVAVLRAAFCELLDEVLLPEVGGNPSVKDSIDFADQRKMGFDHLFLVLRPEHGRGNGGCRFFEKRDGFFRVFYEVKVGAGLLVG